jgi:hypothetical protein
VSSDDENADSGALQWAVDTFGRAWVMGFLDGFDGHARKVADPEYPGGFAAGEQLAQALLNTKESGQTS